MIELQRGEHHFIGSLRLELDKFCHVLVDGLKHFRNVFVIFF